MSRRTTLAIATATGQIGVALTRPDGPAASISLRVGRRHAETLTPAIQSLPSLSGVALSDVELIAVDPGPGLFTGLRVGVATAQALGAALGVPLVACSSLDLLAHPHRRAGRPVASIVDARRGEVFWALYEPVADGMTAVHEPVAIDPDVLADKLAEVDSILLTGDGARRFLAGRGFDVAPEEFDHPSAAVLAELAQIRPAQAPGAVQPLYLRGADVRIGWAER
jgi:tRNA threonylcarbamoyladenosine biosynthesis protein TsaB